MKLFSGKTTKETKVTIDGRDFVGRSITITDDGKVVVDGKVVEGTLVGPVSVTIHGDVERVESVSGQVSIEGSAGNVQTTSGDVEVNHSVLGSVKTVSGDVKANTIGGSVNTVSGDVVGRH